MQKAHLYEAILLVNRGVDDAVRGLERLKKAPGFTGEIYGNTLAGLEHARAQVNLQFFDDMQAGEQKDAADFSSVSGFSLASNAAFIPLRAVAVCIRASIASYLLLSAPSRSPTKGAILVLRQLH